MEQLCMRCSAEGGCPFEIDTNLTSLFEIHVTVETPNPQKFRAVCVENQIKPILIEFQERYGGETATHVMTSQRISGSHLEMMIELNRICRVLSDAGFRIVRKKVEATTDAYGFLPFCYFESHLGFRIAPSQLDALRCECEAVELHLSRNAFKASGETITMMATYRRNDMDVNSFREEIMSIRDHLEQQGFPSDRLIVECCIMDDRVDMDDRWMGRNSI